MTELPNKLENLSGGLVSELARGGQAIVECIARGDDVQPYLESMMNWLEDKAHEGIEILEGVLAWIDGKLETSLAEVSADLRTFVSELVIGLRSLVETGQAFVEGHPEIFRAIAMLVGIAAGAETVPSLLQFFPDGVAGLPRRDV